MPEPLVVRLDDLRAAVGRALDAAQALLGEEIVLTHDYHWQLPIDSAFDIYQKPETLTVGQLSDDLTTVAASDNVEPHLAWHELSHLIGLLRALELHARQ